MPQHKICIAKGCLHHIHFVIHTEYVAVGQSSHLSADILKFALRLCCCCCCCCYLFRLHLCQSPVALPGKPAECPTVSCHPPLPSAPPCSPLAAPSASLWQVRDFRFAAAVFLLFFLHHPPSGRNFKLLTQLCSCGFYLDFLGPINAR